jgi:hypothetical protein
MARASDPSSTRASDSARVKAWAPDSELGLAWASDSDSASSRASDPGDPWSRRAWAASDNSQMHTSDLGLGRAAELFCAAKDAEGLSPRTIAWYRMILDRLVARFGTEQSIDQLSPAELRTWLVELRSTLAPISTAGYVRGLRAFGSCLTSPLAAGARPPHVATEHLADVQETT